MDLRKDGLIFFFKFAIFYCFSDWSGCRSRWVCWASLNRDWSSLGLDGLIGLTLDGFVTLRLLFLLHLLIRLNYKFNRETRGLSDFLEKSWILSKFVGSAAWVVVVVLRSCVYHYEVVVAEDLKPSGNLLQLFSSQDIVVSNWFLNDLFLVSAWKRDLIKVRVLRNSVDDDV